MRQTLLIATAVAALAAGGGSVFAQNLPNAGHAGGAMHSAQAGAGEQSKMNESGAPAAKPGVAQRGTTDGPAPQAQIPGGGERSAPSAQSDHGGMSGDRSTLGGDRSASPQSKGSDRVGSDRLNSNADRAQNTQPAPDRNGDNGRNAQGDRDRSNAQNNTSRTDINTSRTDMNVNLSTEQKTRVRETVVQGPNAPRVGHVDFSLNVGTVVPHSVHVVTVPDMLVEIHPAWRGYMYFVVGDQIVLVEPGTLRIVAVVAV